LCKDPNFLTKYRTGTTKGLKTKQIAKTEV